MGKRACKKCRRLFTVTPQRPNQKFCSCKKCQRARKDAWQKGKMRMDSTYRQNQKDARERGLKKNPEYYTNYRKKHPEYAQKNRTAQIDRNRKNRQKANDAPIVDAIAKMDVTIIVSPSKSISYSNNPAKR